MKKLSIVITVLLWVFLTLPTIGQPQLGILAGVNLANTSVDKPLDPLVAAYDLSNRTGFVVGAVVVFPLSPMLAIQLEPAYMQKGAKLKVIRYWEFSGRTEAKATNKVDYIDIPALLRLSFGQGTTKPYILAGPYVGFLLSAKQKIDKVTLNGEDITGQGPSIDPTSQPPSEIDVETKSIDFGLNFGAGVSFPIGNNTLMLEAMYSLGLVDINDDPDIPDTKVENKGIQIKAAFSFPLGQ